MQENGRETSAKIKHGKAAWWGNEEVQINIP